ncbi:TPA: hypothetical protein LR286_003255 [Enterobacter hormaechei]|nr:hypothetical protein [Enterobacter hormaechei]HBL9125587.1 hypothetical protein [Enterobacter hormaechei]HCC6647856.1 hypothetical protein [Enterobacter hormaechei]
MTNFELQQKYSRYACAAFCNGNSKHSGKVIYMACLLPWMGNNTGDCFPSRTTIEMETGLGEKGQRGTDKFWMDLGILTKHNKQMGDKNRHNAYQINTAMIEERLSSVEVAHIQRNN